MSQIKWIERAHFNITNFLYKKVRAKEIVNIIQEYSLGFVHMGKLDIQAFIEYDFSGENYYNINYITYQIKYFSGFTFIDFWKPDQYIKCDENYLSGWTIGHWTFIYNGQHIFYDKINFFMPSKESCRVGCTMSMPIYNIKNLMCEVFTGSECSPDELNIINNNPIITDSQQEINNLYDIIKFITIGGNIQSGPIIMPA